jgi:transposase
VERLDGIPGVGRQVARVIIAEAGVDMSRFVNADHLASWASLASGKNESAGRNRSARIPPGNRYLRAALVQAAQAAGHSKNTYLGAQFHRIAARRGTKRAAVAVAHSILIIAYHLIRDGTRYIERGPAFFDQRNPQAIQRQLIRRLERLGLKVTVEPLAA